MKLSVSLRFFLLTNFYSFFFLLPIVPDNDSDALTAAFNSVEAKLLPTISSTPLQELVIIYNEVRINDDWTVENFSNHNNKSMKSRFLLMLSNLFTKRFGKMIKITKKNFSVTFSIL